MHKTNLLNQHQKEGDCSDFEHGLVPTGPSIGVFQIWIIYSYCIILTTNEEASEYKGREVLKM